MIFRGPLTDAVLTVMGLAGKPVGDAEAPPEGGWQGEPNLTGTNFVPYSVLIPGVAGPGTGALENPQADWQIGYTVSSFGVSRAQCEWMADRTRDTLKNLRNQILKLDNQAGIDYAVQQVRITTIGSVQRVDTTNPPYWGQVDQFSVWVTKGA